MEHQEVERYVSLSLDGELDPADEAEMAAQIQRSPEARDQIEREFKFKSRLKQKLRSASTDSCVTPVDVRSRVIEHLRTEEQTRRGVPWARVTMVCMASAAVVALVFAGSGPALDPELLVGPHVRNRPPEVDPRGDPEVVRRFFNDHLGIQVSVPAAPDRRVHLVGARLESIANRDAAYMMLDHRGARISVFAYPNEGLLSVTEVRTVRTPKGVEVQVGEHRGYNFVVLERLGIRYAFVSELEVEELTQIVDAL